MGIKELYDVLKDIYVIFSERGEYYLNIPYSPTDQSDSIVQIYCLGCDYAFNVNDVFTIYGVDENDKIINFLNKHNCHLLGSQIKG